MKKYVLVPCCALLLFSLTGCGSKKLVCSRSGSESGVNAKVEVAFEFDSDGKAKDAEMTMTYEFDDKETAEQACELFKGDDADTDEKTSVKCSGSKITVTTSGLSEVEGSDEVIGKTRDEIIKEAEEDGYECK